MHHYVNGGAYICVGVPFDWPRTPDAPVWTYFPRTSVIYVDSKGDVETGVKQTVGIISSLVISASM